MHTFSSAGFGVTLDFDDSKIARDSGIFSDIVDTDQIGVKRTYRRALRDISDHLVETMVTSRLPESIIPYLPHRIRKYDDLRKNLRFYIQQLTQNAQRRLENKEAPNHAHGDDLLSLLVRNSHLDANGIIKPFNEGKRFKPLTESEILGYVYIFSLAGNETTATSLQYALVLLTIYPKAQAWLHTHLDSDLAEESDDPNNWPYEVYAKVRASLCVMVPFHPLSSP